MSPRLARWIAWSLVVLYIILSATGLYFQVLTNTTPGNAAIPILLFIIAISVVAIWPVIGARIVSHHPRHPVGWLLLVTFPVVALDMITIGYATYATRIAPEALPIPGLILVWLNWSGLPFAVVSISLLYLLFPTGKLLSARWRSVAWTGAVALLMLLILEVLEPGPLVLFPDLDNPYGVAAAVWARLSPIYFAVAALLALCSLASLASLFLRLRRATGDERQQLKWLVIPAVVYWIGIPFGLVDEYDPSGIALRIGVGLHLLSVPAIVIAVAFAIFKYRLYDIDVIINRALVYGTLTASVAGVYVLTVGGAGLVVQSNVTLSALLITAIVAGVSYRPMRAFLQARADRLLSGQSGVLPGFSSGRQPEDKQPKKAARSAAPAEAAAQPSARWLGLARLLWYPAFAMALGIYAVAIPGFAIIGSGGVTDSRFSADLSPLIRGLAWVTIAGAAATGLLSLWLAVLLFRQRAGDRMALMTSFFLLAHGVIMAGPLEGLEPFFPGAAAFTQNVLMTLFVPVSLLLFAVFPDGRFVPRWIRWAVAAAFLAVPLALFWNSLYTRVPLDFSRLVVLIATVVVVILAVAIWVSTLYAQIYRYRRVSTPQQRQQTKWVVYGIGLWLSLQTLLSVPWVYAYSLPPGTPQPWWLAAASPFWVVSIAIVPVTLTIAVMRYRLFQIDVIINRTLVYGALTASVLALYALLVGALGVLAQGQGNLFITLLATGLVAVIFQPLRERLQRAVNRLTYGSRDDPGTVFARLGELLQATAGPQEMLPGLVRTVAETLRLPYAAIELGAAGERQVVAAHGRPSGALARFPLIFQQDTIGNLVVAPRTGSATLEPADQPLLENVARQASAVAHAVQLTQALQRSRARLVTAREEERRRLRRDLHDELGPQLASQTLLIQALERRLGKDPASALSLVGELQKQSQQAVADIRRIVYDLRPPALDELGLMGALRESLTPYQRSGARIVFDGPAALPALPAAVEVAAYRIVQEAVANVLRHARASRCHVTLNYQPAPDQAELRLAVEDDGIGLADDRPAGIGLRSMRERAAELGGELSIQPRPGGGTRVQACLPVVEPGR